MAVSCQRWNISRLLHTNYYCAVLPRPKRRNHRCRNHRSETTVPNTFRLNSSLCGYWHDSWLSTTSQWTYISIEIRIRLWTNLIHIRAPNFNAAVKLMQCLIRRHIDVRSHEPEPPIDKVPYLHTVPSVNRSPNLRGLWLTARRTLRC